MAGKIRQKKKTKRSEVTDCGGIEGPKVLSLKEFEKMIGMEPRKNGTATNPKDVKIKNKINKLENL